MALERLPTRIGCRAALHVWHRPRRFARSSETVSIPVMAKCRIGHFAEAQILQALVGALAGLHSLLVVSLFRPGSGIDLWLALLVTGVVTVVLWAVARPFRRLVSMVSLTREQFGGIVPGAGTGPMSRVWQRLRGGEVEDRQTRWWEERRGAATSADGSGGARPETDTHVRVPAQARRVVPPAAAVERRPAAPAGARRPAGRTAPGRERHRGRRGSQASAVGRARHHRRPHDLPSS